MNMRNMWKIIYKTRRIVIFYLWSFEVFFYIAEAAAEVFCKKGFLSQNLQESTCARDSF